MAVGVEVTISFVAIFLIGFAAYLYNLVWLKPEKLRRKLKQQGIDGPPPSFFLGNIPDIKRIHLEATATANTEAEKKQQGLNHDYMSYLFPHLEKWTKQYGSVFQFMLGNIFIVCMSDVETVKDLCLNKSTEFGRSSYISASRGALIGYNSIVTAKGNSWAHQRKTIAPEFFMDKVKGMKDMMVESAMAMVTRWEARIDEAGGFACIRVDDDLKSFSTEIISKTCFGSKYREGNEIFDKVVAIRSLLSKQMAFLGLAGMRYLPIKSNRDLWRLEREIRDAIMKIIIDHERENSEEENDLLKVLVKYFGSANSDNISLIIDNCKAIYFAGHETTATAATFILILLAYHQEWQKQVRDEVAEVCSGQVPTADMLHKMKKLTMVIYEILRLYPPGPYMTRETNEDKKFGNFVIPKGVNIWILVTKLHRDPTLWSENADEFHPERFADGVSGACKVPSMYMPFGTGIRSCAGQYFAMMELKILLSIILSKFSFSLTPEYEHRVAYKLFTCTENGVHLQMQRI